MEKHHPSNTVDMKQKEENTKEMELEERHTIDRDSCKFPKEKANDYEENIDKVSNSERDIEGSYQTKEVVEVRRILGMNSILMEEDHPGIKPTTDGNYFLNMQQFKKNKKKIGKPQNYWKIPALSEGQFW